MEFTRTEAEFDVIDDDEDKQFTLVVLSHLLVPQTIPLTYVVGDKSTVPKLSPLTVKPVEPDSIML